MSEQNLIGILQANLSAVRNQIADACQRSGRDAASVQLVAVTKYAQWEWVQALSRLHSVFGENRPQQLSERHALLPDVQWHLIGQLQRNKVKLALQHAALIHSVDSLRLLSRIIEVGQSVSMRPRILLQANVTGEASKSGFRPDELRDAWPEILAGSERIQIEGLMTMAADSDDPETARPAFQSLRRLRDELASRMDSQQHHVSLTELSMGMSGDFVQAVEEGATLVRIGSRLFEGME